ncbi:AlpA family phage regulatory protein [Sphingosinicella terrae]|uniref:helix-turn-helix transcriptional regulator n=1 Tax=Sphingosinicella terrae TaxID=2172047 RepID=UPI000E0D57DE
MSLKKWQFSAINSLTRSHPIPPCPSDLLVSLLVSQVPANGRYQHGSQRDGGAERKGPRPTLLQVSDSSGLYLFTVLQRTGLSRSTLYRKIQNGTFPRHIAISTRCAGWRESAVDGWMKNPMFYRTD